MKKLSLTNKPVTASLIDPSLQLLHRHQSKMIDFELNGRFLTARRDVKNTAIRAFDPIDLRIDIMQEERGSECETSINVYTDVVYEQIIDRIMIKELKLDSEVYDIFEYMVLKDKLNVEFRQKNGVFMVCLPKKSWYIGFSPNFDQTFKFDTFRELAMFEMISDLLRPNPHGQIHIDHSKIPSLFSRLNSHISSIVEYLASRTSISVDDRPHTIDDSYIAKFAMTSRIYHACIATPLTRAMCGVADLRDAWQAWRWLCEVLAAVGGMAYVEDVLDGGVERLVGLARWLDGGLMEIVGKLPWGLAVLALGQSIGSLVLPILMPVMEAQLREGLSGGLPSWMHFSWLVMKHNEGLKMFFPFLRDLDRDEMLFDLGTISKGKINPSVPARFRVDSKGVAAFFSSHGDWWTDSHGGDLLNHFERMDAEIIKTVKHGPYVWSMIINDSLPLVQKYHMSDIAIPDALDYIPDEVSQSLLPDRIPDFGSKKFIFYVIDDMIYGFPNKAVLSKDDMASISLRSLLLKSESDRNITILQRLYDSDNRYDTYYNLSKSVLVIRYVQRCCACEMLDDIMMCYEWKGGINFEFRSMKIQAIDPSRYYSSDKKMIAKFNFFSQSKKVYCLSYSSITGELSLAQLSNFGFKILLPWRTHIKMTSRCRNIPPAIKADLCIKIDEDSSISYLMNWNRYEHILRIVVCWHLNRSPHAAVYSLRIE